MIREIVVCFGLCCVLHGGPGFCFLRPLNCRPLPAFFMRAHRPLWSNLELLVDVSCTPQVLSVVHELAYVCLCLFSHWIIGTCFALSESPTIFFASAWYDLCLLRVLWFLCVLANRASPTFNLGKIIAFFCSLTLPLR